VGRADRHRQSSSLAHGIRKRQAKRTAAGSKNFKPPSLPRAWPRPTASALYSSLPTALSCNQPSNLWAFVDEPLVDHAFGERYVALTRQQAAIRASRLFHWRPYPKTHIPRRK
jgi:hypothetical protein